MTTLNFLGLYNQKDGVAAEMRTTWRSRFGKDTGDTKKINSVFDTEIWDIYKQSGKDAQ